MAGYWSPAHGGGWSWVSGQNPPQWLINDGYTPQALENPNVTPGGAVPSAPVDPSPPPADTKTPELTQVWQTAPHIPGPDTSDPLNGPSGNGNSLPSSSTPFSVSPGTIEDAENVILAETSTAVTTYDTFREYVESTQSWIFSINNPGLLTESGRNGPLYPPGNLPNQDATNDFIPTQDQVLRNAGDAIELAGKFVAWLNDAAQSYALTDINSFLPPPGGNGGTNATPS
jgi:hypothetical protein